MLRIAHSACAAFLLLSSSLAQVPDPARQFDFWVGEWSVQNRHLREGPKWVEGDTTEARITSMCGGQALLEEWAGPFHGGFMNGFSLRSYEPQKERWTILLFWTMDGSGAFGRMHGSFHHGRGEFFNTTEGDQRTRYTFSDALPHTVRWDQALTRDAGSTWRTDWIMEFTRTAPAAETTADRFFQKPWTTGVLDTHPEARHLDFLVGHWLGLQVGPGGDKCEARMRCKLVSRGSLAVDVLETRELKAKDWDERLSVRAYESRPGLWKTWFLTESEPTMKPATWVWSEPGQPVSFAWEEDGKGRIDSYELGPDGTLTLKHYESPEPVPENRPVHTAARLLSTTTLHRQR